jgi:hypothetical protein
MSQSKMLRPTLVAAAVASVLAAGSASAAGISIVQGTVGGALFTPPTFADSATGAVGSSTTATVYSGATVFFDYNGNGVLDPGEPSAITDASGNFRLTSAKGIADVVALIPATTQSTVTSANATSTSRNVFRASAAQVQAATTNSAIPAKIDITPLSTEVARAVAFDGVNYVTALNNLAERINVSPADVLVAPTKNTDVSELPAILKESVIDTDRFQLAAKFVDRGDSIGELRGNYDCPSVASFDGTNADACSAADLASETSIWDAQNRAQNLEGMPRYDYVFVIIMENESLSSVLGNTTGAPYINAFSSAGSTFFNYYSTGAPSEPNYLSLGSADDWGVAGDEPAYLPYPAVTGVRANVSNSIDAHGLTWRHYEESLYPSPAGTMANAGASSWNTGNGGAYFDNPSKSTIVGNDSVTYPGGVVAKKHNTVVWFADVTAQPNFLSNERSIAGTGTDVNGNAIPYAWGSTSFGAVPVSTGDWDAPLQNYANSNAINSWWTNSTQPWTQDQFLQDLKNGDVANYNVIVPDTKDDMHDTGVTARADYFVNNAVAKIESSPIWKDPTKRVAIVVTYDEGESATTACCGWNPERSGDGAPVPVAVNVSNTGAITVSQGTLVNNGAAIAGIGAHSGVAYPGSGDKTNPTTSGPKYSDGNHGHGVAVFSLYTNQQAQGVAPHGNYDSDYYSHFSFVRSLQDIFGLADPGQPGTYMNRSKYTENFIQQNATLLPEFASSSNPHFDGVRAMNHVYQFPAAVSRVNPAGGLGTSGAYPQSGPDATQTNLWAVK